MEISLILIIIGILGLLILFSFKAWQLRVGKDLTSNMSRTFERQVQTGKNKAVVKVKDHTTKIKEKVLEKGKSIELRKTLENNSVTDLIRGRKKIENNGPSKSAFLNNVSEAKKEIRDELNGKNLSQEEE